MDKIELITCFARSDVFEDKLIAVSLINEEVVLKYKTQKEFFVLLGMLLERSYSKMSWLEHMTLVNTVYCKYIEYAIR